jgi:hypothetical protein
MATNMVARRGLKTFTQVSANQVIGDLTIGTGADCSDCQIAEVRITLGGTTPSWVVTPLFGDGTNYFYGDPVQIDSANGTRQVFLLDVNGSADVNFLCNGSAGTSPTIQITVVPIAG